VCWGEGKLEGAMSKCMETKNAEHSAQTIASFLEAKTHRQEANCHIRTRNVICL
jgi:hypothetical protein